MSLPELALRRPVFITVIFLIVCIVGAVSFTRLPVDLMPDVTFPTMSVQTTYGNVGPEEIEELITVPLERALASTPGLEQMTATASEGNSNIRLSFSWGTDLDSAADEVRTRVDRARGQLPEDAGLPSISKFDVNAQPVVYLGVSGSLEDRALRTFVEDEIVYRLERIPGVAQAQMGGGLSREIHVLLDRGKLNALRLTPAQVINGIRRESVNEPVGQVIEGDFETLMRTEGEYHSLAEIERTVVARREGRPIYVGDVASVEDAFQEVRNLTRVNGEPGIRLGIVKQSGANTVEVARDVLEEIERINRELPQVRIGVISDSSEFIRQSVANVRDAALYGSLLAVLILLLFLRNLRSTLVIAVAIPISVIGTFALMYFYGFTLNTITFGGLALGVGVLVDNSIVVLENIFRHRQDGLQPRDAAQTGSSEVATAITASTLTTIVVFLPIIFISGIAGLVFSQLAWVVSFALFCSLFVALTLVPLLSSRLVRVQEPAQGSWSHALIHPMTVMLDRLDGAYAHAVGWALRHRATVILLTLAVFLSSLALIPMIGFELQPQTDEGEVQINVNLPEGSRLEATDAVARQVEALVEENVPETRAVLSEIGSTGNNYRGGTSPSNVSIRLTLAPRSERNRTSQEIADSLRPLLAGIPGVSATARSNANQASRIMSRITSGGGGGGGRNNTGNDRLSVDIRGYDLGKSFDLALQVRRMMESTEGISDASVDRGTGRPEAQVRIDRTRAAVLGMSVADIAATLSTSVGGTTATQFRDAGDEYPVVVRFREADRQTRGDVLAIPVLTPNGEVVPLASVASMNRTEGPSSIQRKDQERTVTVSANLDGTRDLGSIVFDLQERMRDLDTGPETTLVFTGEWEEQAEAFRSVLLSVVLAVILVYLVMAAQFESFRYPMLIMFSLPLSVIGVAVALFLTHTTANLQAGIGMIMLIGIVVNNAIVLVDYVLQLTRTHGLDLVDALVTAGRRRLRPILMTTLTTVLGLVPMALGLGEGGELQAPMGRVIIGGLLSSTAITLFLIPVLFLTLERATQRKPAPDLPGRLASPAPKHV
jgi:hydrophobic/amphiphilic exporter-1 (mainly G- bacteria), HAE1 family